jgi:hypothetical protein
VSSTLDPSAKTAYDAAAAEFNRLAELTELSPLCRPRDQARTHLSYARRMLRIAALTAPAEGETHSGFTRALKSVTRELTAVRTALDT